MLFVTTTKLTPDRTLIANYDAKLAAYSLLPRFEQKLKAISETVRTETGIDADMTSYALYFSIENGINFSWHQDLESFFLFQDHYHYLNFYVPITKGNQKQSNVSIVPFDQLKIHAPEYYSKLVGAVQHTSGHAKTRPLFSIMRTTPGRQCQ